MQNCRELTEKLRKTEDGLVKNELNKLKLLIQAILLARVILKKTVHKII